MLRILLFYTDKVRIVEVTYQVRVRNCSFQPDYYRHRKVVGPPHFERYRFASALHTTRTLRRNYYLLLRINLAGEAPLQRRCQAKLMPEATILYLAHLGELSSVWLYYAISRFDCTRTLPSSLDIPEAIVVLS